MLGDLLPSSFVNACTFQCMHAMQSPHAPVQPLHIVSNYYFAVGRESDLSPQHRQTDPDIVAQLISNDRAKRAAEAESRLQTLRASFEQQPPGKHLHLKISEGGSQLPQRVHECAKWLHLSPNMVVTECVRDCISAMEDPALAVVPLPIVIRYWTETNAKLRAQPSNATEAMILHSLEKMLRGRSGPVMDTIVRLALAQDWNKTLEQILREADAIPLNDETVKPTWIPREEPTPRLQQEWRGPLE